MRRIGLILALAVLSSPALAQHRGGQGAAKPQPQATPAPGEPQRTTATFAEWTLSCLHPEGAPPACEVTQTVYDKGHPFARTAIGRPSRSDQLRLTILVPSNILVTAAPRFQPGEREPPIELTWRRCFPAGCLADAPLTDEQLRRLRTLTASSRITYTDGGNHDVVIPFSPKGLGPALEALAKETS